MLCARYASYYDCRLTFSMGINARLNAAVTEFQETVDFQAFPEQTKNSVNQHPVGLARVQ
jgi:hypothetical protein